MAWERCSDRSQPGSFEGQGEVEIVYYVAASPDGFIATADGGIDWLKPFEAGTEDYGYAEFYALVEAVLLGRKTYEQCPKFPEWPYPGKPYWVFSRSNGNTRAGVAGEMRSRGLRRAWLIGAGIPLFDGPAPQSALRLAGTRTHDSGIVQLRYVNP